MDATASQTIGPFWHLIDAPDWGDLTRFGAAGPDGVHGTVVTLEGRITDGAGVAVGDAAVELFQAAPARSAGFSGFGRVRTDVDGWFRFRTMRPEASPGPSGMRSNAQQAPHCGIAIFARGLLKPLLTRFYLPDEALLATDPILGLIEPAERRATLIATMVEAGRYRLDIRLQGDCETVFLEF